MLSINMDDVYNVIESVLPQLILIAAVLIIGIVVIVAVMKLKKPEKRLIRGETGVAMVLIIAVTLNVICIGPMNTLLTQVAGPPTSSISTETTDEATALVTEISEEGITLLQNKDNALPLSATNVNVFGWAATSPCYGGTGSGALNDQYPIVTLLQGLEDAGFSYNDELIEFYENYHAADLPEVGMMGCDWTLPEPYAADYSDELISNAKEFSDTAIIVITRVGGEGADLPTDMVGLVNGTAQVEGSQTYDDSVNNGTDWDEGDTYLTLDNPEESMVEMVCNNFDNVVVVYNGASAFELGFVEDYDQIKGVIWCPGTGQSGFDALGEILAGTVNPSGRLVDTFVYDLTATPTFNNMGYNTYDNVEDLGYTAVSALTGQNETVYPTFVNYVEGIYVGYKFYETAAEEGFLDYDTAVQYPFGYGMSYTTFEQEITGFSNDGTDISLSVEVTNTGSVAGKDVVQVYYNPPYTNGGIEKASANLVEFAKTGMLEPGASETVSISFPIENMASYDSYGHGCYVLEAGDYEISIKSDSHNVIASETYTLAEDIVYDESNPRDSDEVAATNEFEYAESDITYLSRADGFANYDEATGEPSHTMPEEAKETFVYSTNYLTAEATAADEDPDAEYPTWGVDSGVKLVELRGLDYDDEMWDTLLDELTMEEVSDLIALGGYQTLAIESIDKYRTNDCDGPASINNNFTGEGSVGFPAAVMIAATFNDDLALAFGESIGKMASEMDVTGWYAPAMNTHRTAFAGRNFEYYSEDGILSGSMAANATIGAEEYGVYAYIKHFAMNDQETNRQQMLCTWSTEQAIREIYLRPFEIAVKEGGAKAVMVAFNYIGNRWCGGSSSLMKDVLRDEWGFVGMALTDMFAFPAFMNADECIRNGTDFCLIAYDITNSRVEFTETAGAQQDMRNSAHDILYVVANSRTYSEEGLAMATQGNRWETWLTIADVVIGILLVAWEILLIYNYRKRKKNS